MASYTAADVIQLPRLTATGATALGEQLLTAAKPHKKTLPSGIAKVLGLLHAGHTSLKAALRDHVLPPAANSADAVACDRDVDACWGGLQDFLTSFTKLPRVPEAAEAATMKATIFPDGLKFTQLTYELEWAESDARLARIKKQGLDKRIEKLGGQIHLKALRAAHAAYGKALGITTTPADPGATPPSVREAMDAFTGALRKYVAKVMGSVDDDDPDTQKLADALLAPLAAWSVGPSGGGSGADKKAEDPAQAEPPQAPQAQAQPAKATP